MLYAKINESRLDFLIEKQSLSRLSSHAKNGFVTLSADRGKDRPKKEVEARRDELAKKLKSLGYGYWKTIGGYQVRRKTSPFRVGYKALI